MEDHIVEGHQGEFGIVKSTSCVRIEKYNQNHQFLVCLAQHCSRLFVTVEFTMASSF
jgi:hypothetical protein